MPNVYSNGPSNRISDFYQTCFHSSPDSVSDAFEKLTGGILDGGLPVPPFLLKEAAELILEDGGELPVPTDKQAKQCGSAFGVVMSELGA